MKGKFTQYLAGSAAGILFAAAPAFAADLAPAPVAPPPPPFTWTGFELGLDVGGGVETSNVNLFELYNFSDTYNGTGPFGGLHLGFNYQLSGPFVVGVQAEYNFAGITGNASAAPLYYLTTSVREFGSVDARAGLAFDRLLVYAIGGFAYGDIRNQVNFQFFPTSVTGFPVTRDFASNRYGWDVGGGLEYAFWGNVTARIEYRYYDFGTRGYNDAGFGNPITIAIPNHTTRETMQTGRIGLTYKFASPFTSPLVAKY
ncbi:MAG TPA: outer membrane beta-barrel protein [Methylocella sp.]|nr:outer membrane beta-barrel protein [Methylocella sp.]